MRENVEAETKEDTPTNGSRKANVISKKTRYVGSMKRKARLYWQRKLITLCRTKVIRNCFGIGTTGSLFANSATAERQPERMESYNEDGYYEGDFD